MLPLSLKNRIGRKDTTNPKYYRPISLTSFLLKKMENLEYKPEILLWMYIVHCGTFHQIWSDFRGQSNPAQNSEEIIQPNVKTGVEKANYVTLYWVPCHYSISEKGRNRLTSKIWKLGYPINVKWTQDGWKKLKTETNFRDWGSLKLCLETTETKAIHLQS